jgi:phosphate transport system permease protein
MNKTALYRRRRVVNVIYLGISMLAVLFGLFWLVWILWTLFAQGLHALDLTMFTKTTPPPGSTGGLANAIFGSLLMWPNMAGAAGSGRRRASSTTSC